MGWKTGAALSVGESRGAVRPFTRLAPYYDALMWDIDYQGWVSYILQICNRLSLSPNKILDLACGTGTCCIILAKKGYEVLGIDGSREMLKVAESKAEAEGVTVDFALKDMRNFNLGEEADLVTCLFDSINYILEEKELLDCFKSVNSVLTRGGSFIFDMNTDYGLSTFWNGSTIVRDEKGVFSIWRNSYSSETKVARLDLTLFVTDESSYRRIDEVHLERGYSFYELRECLRETGFQETHLYHHLTFNKATRSSKRIMVVARKGGKAG